MSASPDSPLGPGSAPGSDDAGQPIAAATQAVPNAWLWSWGVGASLAAGLVAWLVGEERLVAYHHQLRPATGPFPPPEVALAVMATKKLVATQTFVTLGAALGLALGIAGGGARWSVWASGRAAFVGLILGGVGAGAAACVLVPIYFRNHDPLDDSLLLPLLTHAGVAACAGVAGGLALGLGLGGWVGRTSVGGLLGAVGGAIVYEIVGALAFPSGRTGEPLSAMPASRLFFLLAVALLTAVGAVWLARTHASTPRSIPPPA